MSRVDFWIISTKDMKTNLAQSLTQQGILWIDMENNPKALLSCKEIFLPAIKVLGNSEGITNFFQKLNKLWVIIKNKQDFQTVLELNSPLTELGMKRKHTIKESKISTVLMINKKDTIHLNNKKTKEKLKKDSEQKTKVEKKNMMI